MIVFFLPGERQTNSLTGNTSATFRHINVINELAQDRVSEIEIVRSFVFNNVFEGFFEGGLIMLFLFQGKSLQMILILTTKLDPFATIEAWLGVGCDL
jgi:hypothetical protein